MRTRKLLLALLLVVGAGIGAYAAGVATGPETVAPSESATAALLDWLDVAPSQRAELQQHDPAFAAELNKLRQAVARKRNELASALDDPQSRDDEIRTKLEELIAANAGVERRVADYLLTVRDHLTKDQQRRLFGLCAEGIRQGGCGWRVAGGPDGVGRGQGGQGRGLGPGYRGGRH